MPPSPTVPTAYTADQVVRLTGVRRARLARWRRREFYVPEFAQSGLYGFRDLVALGVLAELTSRHRIRFSNLVGMATWLRDHTDVETPWASLAYRVDGRELVVKDPESGMWISASPAGQITSVEELELPFAEVVRRMRSAAQALGRRSDEEIGKTESRRGVLGSARIVAGTRIPTSAVVELIDAGYSVEEILEDYPRLTARDVEAAVEAERDTSAA